MSEIVGGPDAMTELTFADDCLLWRIVPLLHRAAPRDRLRAGAQHPAGAAFVIGKGRGAEN
jgi:hypothetical protein